MTPVKFLKTLFLSTYNYKNHRWKTITNIWSKNSNDVRFVNLTICFLLYFYILIKQEIRKKKHLLNQWKGKKIKSRFISSFFPKKRKILWSFPCFFCPSIFPFNFLSQPFSGNQTYPSVADPRGGEGGRPPPLSPDGGPIFFFF